MASASVQDRLEHVLRSIVAIERYWAGKSFSDFEASEPLRAATEHLPCSTRCASSSRRSPCCFRGMVSIATILHDLLAPCQQVGFACLQR